MHRSLPVGAALCPPPSRPNPRLTTSRLLAVLLCLWPAALALGQGAPQLYGPGMKINLDTSGKKYIRFITWHQIWARQMQLNPGTVVNGEEQSTNLSMGLRRSRFFVYGQIDKRFLITFHFGINNQNFTRGGIGATANYGVTTDAETPKKPQLFIHEATTEYAVLPDNKLWLGAGLHYWNGVSRMANSSTLNYLTIDAPITNWYVIETTDQFARQMGVFAKGYLGHFEYRVAVNQPFRYSDIVAPGTGLNPNGPATNAPAPVSAGAGTSPYVETRNILNTNWSYAGYLKYDFWEKESNLLAFYVGSYVGTKKVLNVGAGWYYHPRSMGRRTVDAGGIDRGTEVFDTKLFGVDAFMDLPFGGERNRAITAYAAWWHYDFGPNYVRNIGIMNPASGDRTLSSGGTAAPLGYNGPGNAFPTIGTGDWLYLEVGYLLGKRTAAPKVRVQPFANVLYGSLQRLADPVIVPAFGANLFLAGHHAKVTLEVRSTPLFDAQRNASGVVQTSRALAPNLDVPILVETSRRAELIIQTQIYF